MGADGQILHSYSPEEMGLLPKKEFDRLFSDVLSYEGGRDLVQATHQLH